MAMIRTDDLIAKFQYALDNHWGYILTATHTKWTQALQNQKVEFMVKNFGSDWKNNASAKKNSSYTAALYGSKWIGHWVTDCSGLFAWSFKELGGYMYHGSNTMWKKYCVSQGKLVNGKRDDGKELKPGTAVFVLKGTSDRSHVGLYIGNGTVIEASGTQTGVITSSITNKKWCEWGELKGVDYNNKDTDYNDKGGDSVMPEPVTGSAVVNDVRVALRSAPSTSATVLTRVNKGERVQVLEDKTWTKVSYQGKTGWMMTKFLNT